MNKFIFKYLILFVSVISLMFFSLTFFQSYTMDKEREQFQKMMNNQSEYSEFDEIAPPGEFDFPQMPPEMAKEPPSYIPLLLIILVSSTLLYFILRYINKNFVEPLSIIENNVERIKEGSLDIEFKTNSESTVIVDTFSTMNDMVQGLKQREKLHDNFIRNLVHDMRAPVIAQERAMEILSEELQDNALVDGLVKNNEAYLKMINSIIESFSVQDIKIDKMSFDFSKLTDTVINALKPAAEAKNIKLETSIQNNLIVWADYISFNRIIMNLVSNAIENIAPNKIVRIKAVQNPKLTTIIIEDNGSGMDEEQKNKIFKDHLSRNKSDKKPVSGMGLSIVYDLVEKNGGEIRVESEKDKYTKFIIELQNEDKNG